MTAMGATQPQTKVGGRRWVIVWLLFFATVINYVDRQMLGVLKPIIQGEMGWSEINYGDIVFYFQAAYSVFYLLFGAFVDRVGARAGYAVAFVIWQLAFIAHAGARNLTQWYLVRMALGVGESGNFPSGIKAVTEWFPKKERAFATGLFNAGSNIGAIVTPLIVPIFLITFHDWRMAFVATGVIGMLWLVAWLAVYREPEKTKSLSATELAYIKQDPADAEAKVGWFAILPRSATWAYAIGKFLIDPVWWMLLFWLPDFFKKTFHVDVRQTDGIIAIAVVYILSDVGSVLGGYLSSALIHRGVKIGSARKIAMLVCALLALPYFFITQINDLWTAVVVIGIVAAAHQGFSANLYTIPGDLFPRRAVGSVVGIGGMIGGIGGMVMAKSVGWVLQTIGGYGQIFMVCGGIYILALIMVQLLVPKYEPVKI